MKLKITSDLQSKVKNKKQGAGGIGYIQSKRRSKEMVNLLCGEDGEIPVGERENYSSPTLPLSSPRRKLLSKL